MSRRKFASSSTVMDDDEALVILSNYIQGCGGKLGAGWQATAEFRLYLGRTIHVAIHCMPPLDFKPADGQQRRQVYKNLKAVAIAMGLPPSRHLATMLTEPAREALKKEFKAASMSSIAASGDDISSYKESSQSLADLAAEQQTPANAETHAAKVPKITVPEPKKSKFRPEHPYGLAYVSTPLVYGSARPKNIRQAEWKGPSQNNSAPANKPKNFLTAPSPREVAPPHVEAAQQADLAGQSDVADETCKSQIEAIEELKRQNRELTGRLTQRDEEMRAMTQTTNHLFDEISALRAASQK